MVEILENLEIFKFDNAYKVLLLTPMYLRKIRLFLVYAKILLYVCMWYSGTGTGLIRPDFDVLYFPCIFDLVSK